MSGRGISVNQVATNKAISALTQLNNNNSAQTHFNANIRNAIQTSTGQSARVARELNEITGEIIREYTLLNRRTVTLARNIQNGFTDMDSDLASNIRESV